MKIRQFVFFILFVFSASLIAQEVTFLAKVDKKKIGVNERLRVDFEMNQDGDNLSPPSFEGFTVVGGPNTSVSRQYVNGKGSYQKVYSYFLAPKGTGKKTIGQAEMTYKGETFKTVPVDVQITAAVSRPNDPNDVTAEVADNIHLVAEISKGSPYLNEAINVVYKLYVAEQTSVGNWREIDSPKFTDFWSQSIDEKQFKIYEGQYKGENYRYVILRRTVLYPQKTGKLELEPLSLDVSVDVPTNRRDIFGRRLVKSANITVSSPRRTINVKPLPEAGKPVDFSGAVGDFDFTVTTDKDELDATEALQLQIEASGKGNLKLFKLPKPTLPSTLEVYEPQNEDAIRTNLAGMSGKKKDVYTIVPAYKGKYPIPPVRFNYFDPKSGTYKTIASEEIVIDVKSGPTNSTAITQTPDGLQGKQAVVANSDQFMFIKSEGNLQARDQESFFKSTTFWTLLGAPLLLIPLALLVRRKREDRLADVSGNRIRKADKLARKFLSTARKNLGDQKAFYIAMERALHNYLKAKLNIQTSDMSKDRIQKLLKDRNVDQQNIIEFISLLESCDFARYTPSSNTAMQQDYDKAARTIATLDKQL